MTASKLAALKTIANALNMTTQAATYCQDKSISHFAAMDANNAANAIAALLDGNKVSSLYSTPEEFLARATFYAESYSREVKARQEAAEAAKLQGAGI